MNTLRQIWLRACLALLSWRLSRAWRQGSNALIQQMREQRLHQQYMATLRIELNRTVGRIRDLNLRCRALDARIRGGA
ncbi:hypothetical protein [Pseudacidovorax intermedius]|uniref:hypothetical protein n=1 Tax=Pseudacidovorax intermedius TaxID=433924 RepID=UPI0026F34CCD|nr:hypothetical protein [Pseudacidovorax intermedius]